MSSINRITFLFGLTFILWVGPNDAYATVPALERNLELNLKNEKISVILNKIEEQSGVIFSYSPQLFKETGPISIQLKNKTVREALAQILPVSVMYRAKNNYIILKEKPKNKNQKTKEVSGYVYDVSNEKKIANASVYDKNTLESTTTNEYGFYSLSVPANNSSITVNRFNYQDTAVHPNTGSAITNIPLQPKGDSLVKNDSALWQKKFNQISKQTDYLVNKFNNYIHNLNVTDSLERDVQVSFVPFVGTNHKLSGTVYNRISFNILGGYARGVKEFELGGLFNIDKENVSGLQIGGLFNLVGDSLRGTQIGGVLNLNGKKTSGLQIAGLSNINGGSVKGVQTAGLLNINQNSMIGLQIGGLMNINGQEQTGTGIAGLFNLNNKVQGVYVAGIGNIQDTAQGALIAGLFNVSQQQKNTIEIAGLFNYLQTGESHSQIAGLFNRTQTLKGIQVGFINYADTASGIPIGFLSLVKKGVHQLEISADEVQYLNLNFRSGVPAFYTIFYSGLQPSSGEVLWSFGYGLGSSFRIKGKLRSDITISAKHLSYGSFYQSPSERLQFYWGLEYKIGKRISVAGGPAMNFYFTDPKGDTYQAKYAQMAPFVLGETNYANGVNMKYWLGAQVALRFF
ncbi:MAG: carboxypeptidase-like regulatory domain-containing protein [Bacteroidia bacterium]|nr:carboxypeptidase-like regulatory domain-containing protein [Bacteroidia bacterium]